MAALANGTALQIGGQDCHAKTSGAHTGDISAAMLRDAYAGEPVAPLREYLDPTDAVGAYAVQAINTRFWEAQGRRVVGRKAGLTAEAVQKQLGVDQPDFGVLPDDMRVADGGRLDPARCIQAKAEAEIAFVLGADLPSPSSTPAEVAAAVASVHAAIEIVDSRIAGERIEHADRLRSLTRKDECDFHVTTEREPNPR